MKHPTREECEELLEKYGTPEHVRNHCREVARTAFVIASALNEKGYDLDLELILAAGLLHDIARVKDRHWDVGADLMEKLGYEEESSIIRVHMRYSPFSPVAEVTETDMVCLGDRLVKEGTYVGLDSRIEYIIDKAKRNGKEDAIPIILEKKEDTKRFLNEIRSVIGMTVDELMMNNEKQEN